MTDLILNVFLPLSLAVIMLGMGMSLTTRDFTRVFRQPKAVILGVINQVVILPLLAFILALAFNLNNTLAIGLIILASSPGGATSNLITHVCNGNIALSITLTAIISITSIITIPFITSYALGFFNTGLNTTITLPITSTIFKIMTITVIPISIGMSLLKHRPKFAHKMLKPMRTASTVIFILIIIGLIATNFNQVIDAIKKVGIITLILNFSIIAIGFLMAKLFKLGYKDAISIGVDGGIQNATLSIVICTTILNSIEMAVPTAAYSIWMYISGAILMWFFGKRNKQKTAPIPQ